jgi:hypothetical protein
MNTPALVTKLDEPDVALTKLILDRKLQVRDLQVESELTFGYTSSDTSEQGFRSRTRSLSRPALPCRHPTWRPDPGCFTRPSRLEMRHWRPDTAQRSFVIKVSNECRLGSEPFESMNRLTNERREIGVVSPTAAWCYRLPRVVGF